MNFIEGRINLRDDLSGAGSLGFLSGLLTELNRSCRTVFARSLAQRLDPKSLPESWAMAADCFVRRYGSEARLTSHQKKMAVRHAKNLRTTANARAKWASGHLGQLAESCAKKIERIQAEIMKLSQASQDSGPMARLDAQQRRGKVLGQKNAALAHVRGRQNRLLTKSKDLDALARSGLASQAFGGGKLAGQASSAGKTGSAFKSKAAWRKAWDEARGQAWLFEGDKAATGANPSVKMDLKQGMLKIALTQGQAEIRMQELASALGVRLEMFKDNPEFFTQRKACRYLSMKLDMTGQVERFATLENALTPSSDPKYKGKTPPCKAPVSWQVWIEGDPSHPTTCKAYARAMWAVPEVPLITFKSNGCLGVDVNAWGVSLAYCQADGNKPSKEKPKAKDETVAEVEPEIKTKVKVKAKSQAFAYDLPIDWTGSSEQSLHQIRVAAKEIVAQAGLLGCPLALELLDFADKKIQLRYEAGPKQAKLLSGFAYQKLFEVLVARAQKVGVEVLWVDPAWTSLVGWAKYGSRLGMNPDQAAAFTIARRAVLSRGQAVKRGKRAQSPGGWVGLHAKPERLEGLGSRAGQAARDRGIKVVNKVVSEVVVNGVNGVKAAISAAQQGKPAQTARLSSGRRSTPPVNVSAERRLSLALGANRRLWPLRLKAAARFEEQGSPSHAQATRLRPGKGQGVESGRSGLPSESMKLGHGRISTD